MERSAARRDWSRPRACACTPSTGTPATNKTPDLLLKVAGAIGTGVGVVGFVTLVGGAIEWVRFREAGLPAIQAVSAVPKAELIATGAAAIVPVIAVTIPLILVLLLLDRPLKWLNKRGPGAGGVLRVLVLSIPAALAAYFLAEKLSAYVYIAAFFLAATLAGFSDWVRAERARAAGTSAFGWYAAMVLISAGVFASIVGFVDTLDRPKVQSAAVLRKGEDRATPGLYVAETADRIYLGEAVVESEDPVKGKAPNGRILVIPRDVVAGFGVGTYAPLKAALKSARALGKELDSRLPPLPEDARDAGSGSGD